MAARSVLGAAAGIAVTVLLVAVGVRDLGLVAAVSFVVAFAVAL